RPLPLSGRLYHCLIFSTDGPARHKRVLSLTMCFYFCYGVDLYVHSFPTRRSSDLVRTQLKSVMAKTGTNRQTELALLLSGAQLPDRKSTRLNSSHVKISYAVFCLKKKKKQTSKPFINTTHNADIYPHYTIQNWYEL